MQILHFLHGSILSLKLMLSRSENFEIFNQSQI